MSNVEVLLTVGKLDASLALLTTRDHHVIEFPTMLLPDNVKAGSIVKMQVSQNVEEETKQRTRFQQIQETILEKYGLNKPNVPVLKIVNITQTSCVLEWDPLVLGSAKLKSLILYRQGIRSTVIPNPFKVTTTKISGLSVDTQYDFQLRLITTSGQYWSERVKLHTHKMTDMSGITVCLGPLDPMLHINERQIDDCLQNIGARPLQKQVGIDTTHFIYNDADNDQDEELLKAKHNNIPIVRPEWIRACETEKRIVGVRGFYLDADASILKSYIFPTTRENARPIDQSEPKEVDAEPEVATEGQNIHSADDEEFGEEQHPELAEDDAPIEAPVEEVIEAPVEAPVEEVIEAPIEEPVEEVIEAPVEAPIEEPVEEVIEAPVEAPIEAPIEEPVEEVIEAPIEAPVEAPVEEVIEAPIEAPVEAPVEELIEEVVEEPAQEVEAPVAEELIEEPAQEGKEPVEEQAGEATDAAEPTEEEEEDTAKEGTVDAQTNTQKKNKKKNNKKKNKKRK